MMSRRIAFYCHHLRGLGHVALGSYLSRTVARDDHFSVALLTSATVPLPVPNGVKKVALPPIQEPLHDPDMVSILRKRSEQIAEFVREWQPDCLIVDQLPLGIGGELLPVLAEAGREGWRTSFALGVAYLEGLPINASRNPKSVIAYSNYSIVLGYQEQNFEPVLDSLPPFLSHARRQYLGIAAPPPARHVPRQAMGDSKRVVVLCGGGFYNTSNFIHLVIGACRPWLENKSIRLTCVAGPLAGSISLGPAHRDLEGIAIQQEGTVEEVMAHADVIVARCGYNTAFTVIQGNAPVVFVPVDGQEFEQINRAKKLARLDRVWSVEEHSPTTAEALAEAITAAINAPFAPRHLPFRTDGAERLAVFLKEAL